MIVLGVVLILIGAAILYFFSQRPDQWGRFAGGVLILLGLILVVIGVFDVADVGVDDADAAVRTFFARSSWGVPIGR